MKYIKNFEEFVNESIITEGRGGFGDWKEDFQDLEDTWDEDYGTKDVPGVIKPKLNKVYRLLKGSRNIEDIKEYEEKIKEYIDKLSEKIKTLSDSKDDKVIKLTVNYYKLLISFYKEALSTSKNAVDKTYHALSSAADTYEELSAEVNK